MKMSVDCAMEIWAAGGGVAAADWQEKTGYGGRFAYRRRPTPVYCKEYTRADVEDRAEDPVFGGYWKAILDRVTRKYPKVRKVIAVDDPVSLRVTCEEVGMPMPQRNADGTWVVGGIVASQATWERWPRGRRFIPLPRRNYAWQDAAKRLAPAMAAGS